LCTGSQGRRSELAALQRAGEGRGSRAGLRVRVRGVWARRRTGGRGMARRRGAGRGRGGRRAEQRSGKERGKTGERGREKGKKENRKKKRGKERREREIVRASEIRSGDRGWSAMRALSSDTQRVARSGKKKMGRQPNSGVGTVKIAGKGYEKKLGASDGRDVLSSTTKINFEEKI